MRHPFFQWLKRFQSRYRRSVEEFVLEATFLYVGTGFLIIGGIDYFLYRFWAWESSTWRMAALAALAVGGIWLFFRLFPLLRQMPRTEKEILKQLRELPIGKRLPQSAESALSFLQERQKTDVSEELRQAVIAEATEQLTQISISESLSGIDWHQNRWHFRRWMLILFLLYLLCFHFYPKNMTTGAIRLVQPWQRTPWTLNIPLTWKEIPEKLVEGDDFLAELCSQGDFPQLRVALWTNGPSGEEQPPQIYALQPIDNRYRVRLPDVRHSFRIAAFWQGQGMENETLRTVSVHPKPTLQEAQIHIVPPRYTGKKPYTGHWEVAGLPQTRVGILITSRQPLQSARILFSDGTFLPGRCYENDPCRYLFVWEIVRTLSYQLELTDEAGITNRLETWQCLLQTDLPPSAALKEPSANRPILPGATISVNVAGKDDYGLAALGFRWLAETAHSQPETRSPRWTPFQLWNPPDDSASSPPQRKEITFRWELSSLKLMPGSRIRLEPFGEDAALKPIFGEEVTLQVVTPEEMSQRFFRHWSGLTQEIRRLYQILLQTEAAAKDSLAETQTAAENLFRKMDRRYPDSFWPILEVLTRDLYDNPSFPITHDFSSADQQETLENLIRILTQMEKTELPALKQVLYQAQLAVERSTAEEKAEVEIPFRTSIEPILAKMIHPLKQWLENWESSESRIDLWEQLEKIAALQESLFQETVEQLPNWIGQQPDQWSSQAAQAYAALFQKQKTLAEQTQDFFAEYSRLYPHQNAEMFSSVLCFFIREMTIYHRERLFGKELACQQEISEEWQMFRQHLTSQEIWIPTLAFLVKKLAQIQSQQYQIVREWEAFREETVLSRTHRLRQLRHAQKQRNMKEDLEAIPHAYPVSVQILLGAIERQLEQSSNQFVILASEKLTHPNFLQNQYLLQEEILRALEQLKTELEKNPSDNLLAESDESLENRAEKASERNSEEKLPVTAIDIQLLATLQEENRNQTLAQVQNPHRTDAAVTLLEKRQKQILQIAKALGFETHKQSTSSNILAQMNQVHYLFTQKEISTLNTTIQREIVYQLNQMLMANSQETDTGTENSTPSDGLKDNPSTNRDSTDTTVRPNTERVVQEERSDLPSQTFRKKIWGELPHRLQQALPHPLENAIFPEYEEEIQAYYRFLLETTRIP